MSLRTHLLWLVCLGAMSAMAAERVSAQSHARLDSLRRPGVTLHYRVSGRGEPILILSGGPGAGSGYLEPVYTHVARRARAILLDQRGTGRSSLDRVDSSTVTLRLAVEDVEALRQRLGVDRFILLGHSWGGQLALAYTAAHPAHVRALVLVGSAGAGGPDFGAPISERLAARLTPLDIDSIHYWSGRTTDPRVAPVARIALRRLNTYAYFYDRRRAVERLKYVTDAELTSRTGGLMLADLAQIGFDLRADLWRIGHDQAKRPAVAILYGEADPIGASTAPQIRAAFPSATVKVFPRSGHYPWIETPDAFYRALDEFLGALQDS